MRFSSMKAQEIYESLRREGKINYAISLGNRYMSEKTQYQPGPKWSYDSPGLREELKRRWESSVNNAEDKDWDEIAKWVFDLATLAK
jgi:hypothetical protein